MAVVRLLILHGKIWTKMFQDVWRKIDGQENSRAIEDYLAVGKTRLDVFVSFRHALRVRSIPL